MPCFSNKVSKLVALLSSAAGIALAPAGADAQRRSQNSPPAIVLPDQVKRDTGGVPKSPAPPSDLKKLNPQPLPPRQAPPLNKLNPQPLPPDPDRDKIGPGVAAPQNG